MSVSISSKTIVFSTLILSHAFANATDVRFNGFASFIGGMVLDSNDNVFLASAGEATLNGLLNQDAFYDDEISFRPDSIYGLKVSADVSEGLTATAQLMGRGANGYDAEIEWAYLSYQLGNNLTLSAGRQRTPVFQYSSFVDVGYAYHWIRPPVTMYTNIISTYEGMSLGHKGNIGEWDTSTRLYAGTAINEQSQFGDLDADNLIGFEYIISNDWLQLRASSLTTDVVVNNPLSINNSDNPFEAMFSGLSAFATLGNAFFGVEGSLIASVDSDDFLDIVVAQIDQQTAFLVTGGYRIGDFTPHISYSESSLRQSGAINPIADGLKTVTESVAVGLRWDFHPSAAFKIEYTANTDASDQLIINQNGSPNDVDLLRFGFDIIF